MYYWSEVSPHMVVHRERNLKMIVTREVKNSLMLILKPNIIMKNGRSLILSMTSKNVYLIVMVLMFHLRI